MTPVSSNLPLEDRREDRNTVVWRLKKESRNFKEAIKLIIQHFQGLTATFINTHKVPDLLINQKIILFVL